MPCFLFRNRSHRLPSYQGTADYELFFLLLLVGTAETIGFKQIYDMMDGADRDAGDFGFDPLMLLKVSTLTRALPLSSL